MVCILENKDQNFYTCLSFYSVFDLSLSAKKRLLQTTIAWVCDVSIGFFGLISLPIADINETHYSCVYIENFCK